MQDVKRMKIHFTNIGSYQRRRRHPMQQQQNDAGCHYGIYPFDNAWWSDEEKKARAIVVPTVVSSRYDEDLHALSGHLQLGMFVCVEMTIDQTKQQQASSTHHKTIITSDTQNATTWTKKERE